MILVRAVLKLLRPKQYTKNLLVFTALLFTAGAGGADAWTKTLIAFFAMCLLSSAVYVVNDVLDAERDRAHPVKRTRPIASGAVSVPLAWGIAAVLAGGSAALTFQLPRAAIVMIGLYLAVQVLYNAGCKRIPVTDVFLIATGFVLRAALGAAAIDARFSGWLLFCTGTLALMLGFGKRRHEFILQGQDRAKSRESLVGYSRQALDTLVAICATGSAICYGVYSIESETARRHPMLLLTTLFVAYGVCRYVYVVFGQDEGGEPENLLLRDPHIIASVLLFVATAVLALSVPGAPILDTQ
jgi:4-hydroxybenzoate polyprenyltransferase